jgi:hypothetical protein
MKQDFEVDHVAIHPASNLASSEITALKEHSPGKPRELARTANATQPYLPQ